jgi:hypothetical protein
MMRVENPQSVYYWLWAGIQFLEGAEPFLFSTVSAVALSPT